MGTELNYIVVDAHCDTITKLMDIKSKSNQGLYENSLHFDLTRTQSYGGFVQFFAAYISPDYCPNNAYARCRDIMRHFEYEVAKNQDSILHVKKSGDIKTAINQNKVAAVLTIENGAALEGDINKLQEFYDLGVRSIGLTWNGSNQIACGVKGDEPQGGLTTFGREVVTGMNELGMIIDVSHLTETSFWDVMEATRAPIIASHSNAKKIHDHPRNLTNQQFEAVIKNNGVVGINLYPLFLNGTDRANINDILRHIEHLCGLGGTNNIGIGADFDGIPITPTDVTGIQYLSTIFEALLQKNYTEEIVKNIAGLNFLRVINVESQKWG